MADNNPPVADAGPDQTLYLGDTAVLHGSAVDPDGDDIKDWHWEVVSAPAGSSYQLGFENTPEALFTAATAGNYVITLIATDGLQWSDPDPVLVMAVENQPPTAVATATPVSGPAPLVVSFDGSQSFDPEEGALAFYWDFGDHTHGTGAAPDHEYGSPGTYAAVLKVTDDHGNIDIDTVEITVTAPNSPPEADPVATPDSGISPLAVQFIANASDADGDPLTFVWDFGDPGSADNTSTQADPQHVYEQPGTYTAWLTVSDGIEDVSVSVTVVVSSGQILSTRQAAVVKWGPDRSRKGTVFYRGDIDLPVPAPDDVISFSFDGRKLFAKPFSAFRPGLQPNVYVVVRRRLLVRIDFDNQQICVVKRKVNLKKFDNSDGVDVELLWGDEVAVDQFVMDQVITGVWTYERSDE